MRILQIMLIIYITDVCDANVLHCHENNVKFRVIKVLMAIKGLCFLYANSICIFSGEI